jgi:predicted ATPase/DNA-binding winged helix-turn-helix (wHTH) protein
MTDRFRFDHFELDAAERTLTIAGEAAVVGARAFDLLLALVERRGRVVPKAELLDLVWPGLVVEENNLQVQVSALRKLLGTNAITTVAGRGYRFTAALEAPPAAAPAGAAAPAPPRTNLAPSRTRFIGREAALADGARLLGESRLLTLTGIGGCGKTRLAQELARRQLAAFADGVWFVDLAPVQEGARVAPVVAATLGVRELEGESLRERLQAHVARRQMLLVVDNCEHLIDAVVDIVDELLGASPGLRIVATSREAFGIDGEQIYPVRSLSLPAAAGLEAVRDSESARVFVDRARLLVPDFALDETNAPLVAEICRRLDGIALAIELAAARVALLSVEEIRDRLDDRFRLLSGGGRALPRHQTLQAMMLWSYDQLSPVEQQLFRRLSVFVGGWTLAAVAEVAGSGDEYDVLALLTALHDKSLLAVDREGHAAPRYRMLETVRQYAQERLAESGEGDAMRSRHLRFHVALAERTEPLYLDARQGEAIALQRAGEEDLFAAHAWCDHDADGASLGVRLAAASWRYWRSSGQLERGRTLALAALARGADNAAAGPRCRLVIGLATLAYYMGRYDESRTLAAQGLAEARVVGDLGQVASALVLLTFSAKADDDPRLVIARYEEISAIALATGDLLLKGRNLNNLAEWHRACGRPAEAAACYEKSLATHRAANNPGMIAIVLCNYARLLIGQGQSGGARAQLVECIGIARANGLRGMDEHLLEIGVGLAVGHGDAVDAARLHGASLARMRESGAKRETVDEAFLAPWLARARAAAGAAAFDAAERAGIALEREASLAELLAWLAKTA